VPDPIVSPEAVRRALELEALADRVGGITAGPTGRRYPEGALTGGKVRLSAPQEDYAGLAGRAFQAGTIGGTVGLGGVRGGMAVPPSPEPMVPLTEIDLGGGRKVTVGGRTYADLANTMSVEDVSPGRVGVDLNVRTSPENMPRWLHQPWASDVVSGKKPFPEEGVEEALNVIRLAADPEHLRVVGSSLPPGSGIARGQETGFTAYLRALQEAQKRGLGFMSDTSLNSMSRRVYEKLREKGVPFADINNPEADFDPREILYEIDPVTGERVVYFDPRSDDFFELPEERLPRFGISAEELGKVDLDKIMTSGGPTSTAHAAERAARPSRLGSALKTGGKALLNPVGIVADAVLGGAVGAGSAVAGHRSAAPASAGLLSLPGEGYEGLVRPDDIVRAAEAMEADREALRQQRLREVYDRYGFGYVPYTARLDELNEILGGPLR